MSARGKLNRNVRSPCLWDSQPARGKEGGRRWWRAQKTSRRQSRTISTVQRSRNWPRLLVVSIATSSEVAERSRFILFELPLRVEYICNAIWKVNGGAALLKLAMVGTQCMSGHRQPSNLLECRGDDTATYRSPELRASCGRDAKANRRAPLVVVSCPERRPVPRTALLSGHPAFLRAHVYPVQLRPLLAMEFTNSSRCLHRATSAPRTSAPTLEGNSVAPFISRNQAG